jgi:hypothetical protein
VIDVIYNIKKFRIVLYKSEKILFCSEFFYLNNNKKIIDVI